MSEEKEKLEKQEIQQTAFASSLPYPDICITDNNPAYGRAMLDNVGGSNSEMTAISLYFYNNLITSCCEEISVCFHRISIVEMHHMKIFGQLAKNLGMDPRLWTRQGRRFAYWTPGYNQYPVQLNTLLLNAIRGEKAAVEKYHAQAGIIKDSNICAILDRIILDEQLHIEILSDLYEKYCR